MFPLFLHLTSKNNLIITAANIALTTAVTTLVDNIIPESRYSELQIPGSHSLELNSDVTLRVAEESVNKFYFK